MLDIASKMSWVARWRAKRYAHYLSLTKEPELRLLSLLMHDRTFVDIGANQGVYSTYALKHGASAIIAAEPIPMLAARLKKLIGRHGIVHEIALSLHEGVATMSIPCLEGINRLTRATLTCNNSGGTFLKVRTNRLDQLNIPKDAIIKIDVEGFELNVLEGAERLLIERPPAAFLIESEERQSAGSTSKVIQTLAKYGYEGWAVLGATLIPSALFNVHIHQSEADVATVEDGQPRPTSYANNFLFLRADLKEELIRHLDNVGFNLHGHGIDAEKIHLNGLNSEHDNIAAIYKGFMQQGDIFTTLPLRKYATHRWPAADVHVLHLHWIDHIADGVSLGNCFRMYIHLMLYLLLIRLRSGRIVWTMHNVTAHEVRHKVLERVVQWSIVNIVQIVHSPNESIQRVIEERWPTRISRKAICLPLPEPTARMKRLPRDDVRKNLGLTGDETLVVAFGNIRHYKGFDLLAQAFVMADAPSLRLIIAGECRDKVLLTRMISILSPEGRADLRPCHQSEEEISRLFAAADWVILPYRSGENSGIVPTALAFGIPLIVSDCPGLLVPLTSEPDCRIVVRRSDGVCGIISALQRASHMTQEEWQRSSAAARRLSKHDNLDLGLRYRALYLQTRSRQPVRTRPLDPNQI